MSKPQQKQSVGFWSNLSISSLEADVAYFEARVVMVGEPETVHQMAQLKAYRELEKAMIETLARLRGEIS